MSNIGLPEIAIVLLIVLVIFGPKRLPQLGRSLGSGMREFKDAVTGKNKGDDDAKTKVENRTKVENENAPDAKSKSNAKVEVPRGPLPQLMAMSVKTLGPTCSKS